jgi:hypothetical protein
MPEDVRQTPREDLFWLKTVKAARGFAAAERARRLREKEEQEASADKGQVGES